MRWRLAVLSSMTVLHLLAGAPGAAACSCEPLTDEVAFDQAGAVFVGRATSRGTANPDSTPTPGETVVWTFEVSEVYKGGVRRTQQVVSAASGETCGISVIPERTYLVFAGEDPAGPGTAPLTAYLCGGTRPGTSASLSAAVALPRAPLAAGEPSPALSPPAPVTPVEPDPEPDPGRPAALTGIAVAVVAVAALVAARRRR